MKKQYGVDSMPETGENVAEDYKVSREDQDAFAVRSQNKAAAAQNNGRLARKSPRSPSRSARAIRSSSTGTSIRAQRRSKRSPSSARRSRRTAAR
jgi:hypothetical protein